MELSFLKDSFMHYDAQKGQYFFVDEQKKFKLIFFKSGEFYHFISELKGQDINLRTNIFMNKKIFDAYFSLLLGEDNILTLADFEKKKLLKKSDMSEYFAVSRYGESKIFFFSTGVFYVLRVPKVDDLISRHFKMSNVLTENILKEIFNIFKISQ